MADPFYSFGQNLYLGGKDTSRSNEDSNWGYPVDGDTIKNEYKGLPAYLPATNPPNWWVAAFVVAEPDPIFHAPMRDGEEDPFATIIIDIEEFANHGTATNITWTDGPHG